jgi:hypothetical protein
VRSPTRYRDGKAKIWCTQCGLGRVATEAVGRDEDDNPACREHLLESSSTTPEQEVSAV